MQWYKISKKTTSIKWLNVFKNYYQNFIFQDFESVHLAQLIQLNIKKNESILDVGCGNGRYLELLKKQGYSIEGVEKNVDIVNRNKKNGFSCYTPEEFKLNKKKYNLIILSHIIEHFSPNDLLDFLNYYLDRLERNGFLIIATPLLSPYFYDDFDHVKPYHPLGIEMVFGKNNAQVQYQSNHKLELKSIWYRRTAYLSNYKNRENLILKRFYQCYDFIAAVLFYMSFKIISRKDGWLGLYIKH